jgi:hypothetical protein
MNFNLHKAILFIAFVFLSSAANANNNFPGWDAREAANYPAQMITLSVDNKLIGTIERTKIQNLVEIQSDLQAKSGVYTKLLISPQKGVNAFAFEFPGKDPFIAFTIDMLNQFGNDKDLLACVMGHEMAHIHQHHVLNKLNRQNWIGMIGNAIGQAIDAKTGGNVFANTLEKAAVSALGTIISMKFSREEEAEADSLAFQWASDAKYNVEGAIRLFSFFQSVKGDGVAFLQEHPINSERIESAKNFIAIKNGTYKAPIENEKYISQNSLSTIPGTSASNENKTPKILNKTEIFPDVVMDEKKIPKSLNKAEIFPDISMNESQQTLTKSEPSSPFDKFASGKVVLDCTLLCSASNGAKRQTLKSFYNEGKWVDLAALVASINFPRDLNYFYLGRSAEELKLKEAARVYYKTAIEMSQTSKRCDYVFKYQCNEIDVLEESRKGLKRLN